MKAGRDDVGRDDVGRDGAALADLRLVPPATAVWVGALLGLHLAPRLPALLVGAGAGGSVALPAGGSVALAAGLAVALAALAVLPAVAAGLLIRAGRHAPGRRRRGTPARLAVVVVLACLLAGAAAGGSRALAARAGPVPGLAGERAYAAAELVLTSDPRPHAPHAAGEGARRPEPPGGELLVRARVERVTARGTTSRVRTPVLLLVPARGWASLLPGQRVRAGGRLARLDGGPAVALLRVRDPPQVLGRPGALVRAAEPLRAALRRAVRGLPPGPRGLVPALVVGDETAMPAEVTERMRTTGLTHLTAVSGANVAIVLAAVLGLARAARLRGYARPVVGVVAVLGFVVLARSEPSVLRAAAMGLVAVAGLAGGGRRRGIAALGAAVLVLLLVDPWLAVSAGFTLSVLATVGILVLAPVWRNAARWLPRWLAEALSVPLAAQVACGPVIVLLADEVSLASLPANLLAAPAVAPATVLGAAAAVVGPVLPPVATVLGLGAGLPAAWIVLVADRGAALPGAAAPWPGGPGGALAAVAVSAVAVLVLPVVLRRRLPSALAGVCLAVALARPGTPGQWLPAPSGWPPQGWVLVACQVGQGDALVVNAGPGAAVVVDAGPDPAAVDRCLDGLHVTLVPAVVLTHFHADHVAGLPGVLDGRAVAEVVVSPWPEPDWAARQVAEQAAAAGVPVTVAAAGDRRRTGQAEWDVVWPRRVIGGDEGSAPNNASVVLDLRIDGLRLLLTGDVEPPAQDALRAALGPGPFDVLKVPHHGSAYQQPEVLTGLGARLAVVSAGADNDYGHPAASTLDMLVAAGVRVARTDTDGAVAVVTDGAGGLGVVTRGDRPP